MPVQPARIKTTLATAMRTAWRGVLSNCLGASIRTVHPRQNTSNNHPPPSVFLRGAPRVRCSKRFLKRTSQPGSMYLIILLRCSSRVELTGKPVRLLSSAGRVAAGALPSNRPLRIGGVSQASLGLRPALRGCSPGHGLLRIVRRML